MRVNYGQTVHGEAEIAAVVEVLQTSTQMGARVRAMEERVARLFNKRHGIMVNSGSSANYLAVELLNLPPGSEVITPALTFATTVAPIVRQHLVPAFVDASEGTYNIDVDAIEAMIGPNTRAMMIPSLIGNLPDWDRISAIADAHGLLVVEDSADTLGATLRGRSTGARSHISTTSFYGSHVINAAGNGGMLCVDDDDLARRALLLRSWGRTSSLFVDSENIENRFNVELDGIGYDAKFVFEELGHNFEPSEIGAAFGLVQLDKLERNIAAREANFARHLAFFADYEDWFILPRQLPDARTGWLAFPLTIRADAPFTRRDLQIYLEQRDIQTRPVFTGNILRQPAMAKVSVRRAPDGYPVADDVMRGGVLLACHHGLTEAQIDFMHGSFQSFASRLRGKAAGGPGRRSGRSLSMTLLHACRACLAPEPYLFLPMGDHPPANMFVRPDEVADAQPAFPLNTQACLECGLIQIADQIPADFFRHYLYVPSGAATMHRHFGDLAGVLTDKARGGLIVDIGCNDGLLLAACNAAGARTLGIDPAANIAEIARSRGVDVHVSYFNPDTAAEIRETHGPAKIIVTTNTFNHIGDLHGFMRGVMVLLADDGEFVVEVPWAKDLLEKNEFDTVYQEHLSEFSLLSMARLGGFFDLAITDVHRLPVHGGSMRIMMRRRDHAGEPAPIVQQMLDEELKAGMLEAATYEAFADRIAAVHSKLVAMLRDLKDQGLKIAGYGAPAKGNTLLNYFAIDSSYLDFLVDRNPLKHGLYSPGMRIPIRPTEAIRTEKPDVLLVLAWNFFDEIREQQADFVAGGGKFLVPLPEPVLVS